MFFTIADILFPFTCYVLGLSYGLDDDVLGYVSAGMTCLVGIFMYLGYKQHIAQKVRSQSDVSHVDQ